MRNIEEIAAEEDAILREVWRARLRWIFNLLGFALSLWGWVHFSRGFIGAGALAVTLGLICWAAGWGLLRVFLGSWTAFWVGIPSLGLSFGLYFFTRLPSFYWGKDPAFWYSVHAGAVDAPLWSPLSYLLGEAACFMAPAFRFSLLPILSVTVLSLALFLTAQDYFFRLKNKTPLNVLLALLVCGVLILSPPFWNAGTRASGMPAGLGLLLFLCQRSLLGSEERPWKAVYFLLGLLVSVHPFWGLLGLFRHWGSLDPEGRDVKRNLFPFVAGFTPYLWVFFRAGRVFPSWGGDHPFLEALKSWRFLGTPVEGSTLMAAWTSMGWSLALLMATAALLWFLNFFKWKAGAKIQLSVLDFWVWVAAGLGGILFYAPTSFSPGPSFLWFGVGLGGMFLAPLEKGIERRQVTFFSGKPLIGMGFAAVLLSAAAAFLPGQGPDLGHPYFPQQHALNLLQTLGPKSVLVCHDPFDAAACREARLMEPSAQEEVLLDERYLNRRWYVTQVIRHEPEILFSNILGPPAEVLNRMVLDNKDLWDIHWDLPVLPAGWKGSPAAPTVLTQEFQGTAASAQDPEKAQYRLDLAGLNGSGEDLGSNGFLTDKSDLRGSGYFDHYILGFNELGKYLMGQGRYPGAIHAFERAVKLDPGFKEPQSYLDQMYAKQNILEAARLEFEKAVKTGPAQITQWTDQLEKAQKSKDDAQAALLLDQMVHLNAQLADAEFQLSKIYGKEGRVEESKSLLESSVKLNPQQLEAEMNLGHLMERLSNRIKAEEAFRAVLEIDPQNKEAQVELWKLLNKP